MAIKVKAVERNVSFQEGVEKYAFVLQADLYNKLSQAKVIQEASLRSGIPKGSINAAWDAIAKVIKAWATEGHAVAVQSLGSMRFGIRSKSVENVNDVAAKLIISRRVIFTPSTDIKDELASTSINITCYDRNGKIIKRVTSTDDAEVEDNENEGNNHTNTDDTNQSQNQTPQNQSRQYNLNTSKGTVDESVNKVYTEGSKVNIVATPASGLAFDKWSDGITTASRTVTMDADKTLVASFKEAQTQDGGTEDEGDAY